MKRKPLIFWVSFILMIIVSFGYPPVVGNSQSTLIHKDSIDITAQILQVAAEKEAYKNTIRNSIVEIREKKNQPNIKVKYRTKYKKVVVRDTVLVHDSIYIPIQKSVYYIKSKAWSDSLAREQFKIDSVERKRNFELRHRSIIQKIFGSKKIKK